MFGTSVSAQVTSDDPLFVTAAVDSERPYLGQQITYVFSIYQGPGLDTGSREVRYEAPTFAGFWNSQEVEQEEYSATVDSRDYHVIELRTPLFPTVIGTAVIEPGVLTVSEEGAVQGESFVSDTVSVEVRPLPAGAISGFTGAVGRFDISAQADTTSSRTGEPVQLQVVVSGKGNIEALPEPDWPGFDGWRVVRSPVVTETEVMDGLVVGSRTYGMSLIAEKPGDLPIPEIGYHHFDPEAGEYVETATTSITVSVAGTDGVTAPPSGADADPASEGREMIMRPIKPVPSTLRQGEEEATENPAYWAAWIVPPMLIVGALLWRRRRASLEEARAELLRQRALPDAQAALSRAGASGTVPSVASANALLSYCSARLEIKAGGMTRGELLRRLSEAGVEANLAERVEDILSAGEASRYAPSPEAVGGGGDEMEQTAQLLDELEEAIGA